MTAEKPLIEKYPYIDSVADCAEDAIQFIIKCEANLDYYPDVKVWIQKIDPFIWDVATGEPEISHDFIKTLDKRLLTPEVYDFLIDWIAPANSQEDQQFLFALDSYEEYFFQ